jgi:hypothetical protein
MTSCHRLALGAQESAFVQGVQLVLPLEPNRPSISMVRSMPWRGPDIPMLDAFANAFAGPPRGHHGAIQYHCSKTMPALVTRSRHILPVGARPTYSTDLPELHSGYEFPNSIATLTTAL